MIVTSLIALGLSTVGPTSTVTHTGRISEGLVHPGRLAARQGGGVYVTDSPSGHVLEYDGGGTLVATHAVAAPMGIASLADGRVFVSHADGSLNVYDAAFSLLGPVSATPLSLTSPNDLAVHAATGELYAVDAQGDQILVFAESSLGAGDWGLARAWGIRGSGLSGFETPQAIAIDPVKEHVIVTDVDNYRVQVFSTTGIVQFAFGHRILFLPGSERGWFMRSEGVAVDACGNIYVADALMGTVRVFDSRGGELDPAHAPVVSFGSGPGDVRTPCDVLIVGDRLHVVSANRSSVEVYDVTCTVGVVGAGAIVTGRGGYDAEERGRGSDGKLHRRPVVPDHPFEVVAALETGVFSASADLNLDRVVDVDDLAMATRRFGVGGVESVLQAWSAEGGIALTDFAPPHVIDIPIACGRCHSDGIPDGGMTTAAGQANLCMSCHTASGIASTSVLRDADRADPYGSGRGTSHAWDVPAINAAAGAVGPSAGSEMERYLDEGRIKCATCHDQHDDTYGSYLRQWNNVDQMCRDCHAARVTGAGSHPVGMVYADDAAHAAVEDLTGVVLKEGQVQCMSCHGAHHMDSGGANGGLGDGNLLRTANDEALCMTCHTGPDAPMFHGTVFPQNCRVCHHVHQDATSNLSLIGENLETFIGPASIVFWDNSIGVGPGAFVDPDPNVRGICEGCHSYPPTILPATAPAHTIDPPMAACTSCHEHRNGFEIVAP